MSDHGGEQPEVKPENQHVALKLQGPGFPELVIKVKRSVLPLLTRAIGSELTLEMHFDPPAGPPSSPR